MGTKATDARARRAAAYVAANVHHGEAFFVGDAGDGKRLEMKQYHDPCPKCGDTSRFNDGLVSVCSTCGTERDRTLKDLIAAGWQLTPPDTE